MINDQDPLLLLPDTMKEALKKEAEFIIEDKENAVPEQDNKKRKRTRCLSSSGNESDSNETQAADKKDKVGQNEDCSLPLNKGEI